MASFSEWSNNKMRQATGTAKTTGTPQKAQTFSAWSNQKLGKVDTQKNPASGNTAFERSGKTRDEYDSSVRQNYAARAAASDKLTESEYNRSTAMQQKYGSYQNYLVGATADGKYYSQPKLGMDMERKYNTVTTYEANAKKKAEELQNAKENMEIVKNGITSRYKELSNTQIRSTIDGMILDVPVKVGNSVIQSNTFNDGTTIATVADMSNMLFRGNVDETDVGKLHETMPVKLTIGALQNVELDALLEYVSPKATEDNGVIMFEVKAAVKIPENVFVRAGYSANASIVIQSREGVLTLPESTVEFEGDKTYVYLLTSAEVIAEQTFDKREVKIGLSDGINIELTEGVTADDKVRGAKEDKKK